MTNAFCNAPLGRSCFPPMQQFHASRLNKKKAGNTGSDRNVVTEFFNKIFKFVSMLSLRLETVATSR